MSRGRGFYVRLTALPGIAGIVAICILSFATTFAFAHEVRPAYLALKEEAPGTFSVFFKTPMLGELRLALEVKFSGTLQETTPVNSRVTDDALIQTWWIRANESLCGQEVRIAGLESTMTDALVRIEFADGQAWVQRLTPATPWAIIPARPSGWTVAGTYLGLGVEHILFGFDHLLFVFALMLIAANARDVVKAITAFTAAHSITLAAATLGFVNVPAKPVEAAIALSIAFVAAEIVRARQGETGMTARMPWLVAFAFGLLHGFGFAGALGEIGMPAGHIPEALLFFNIGVEIGQLIFVAGVLGLIALVQRGRWPWPRWWAFVPPYAVGIVAMFWVIERVSAF